MATYNQKYPNLEADLKWISKNKHLFKGIIPGKIYTVFQNDEIVMDVKYAKFKYKSLYRRVNGKSKIRTTRRISENGNFFIKKIAICECGEFKAGNKMRRSICHECVTKEHNKKMLARHYKKNKSKPDYSTNTNKEKKKVVRMSVADLVLSIIKEPYQKVETKQYVPDVFEDLWINRTESLIKVG